MGFFVALEARGPASLLAPASFEANPITPRKASPSTMP